MKGPERGRKASPTKYPRLPILNGYRKHKTFREFSENNLSPKPLSLFWWYSLVDIFIFHSKNRMSKMSTYWAFTEKSVPGSLKMHIPRYMPELSAVGPSRFLCWRHTIMEGAHHGCRYFPLECKLRWCWIFHGFSFFFLPLLYGRNLKPRSANNSLRQIQWADFGPLEMNGFYIFKCLKNNF